jgi:hypothetical protein
MGLTNPAKQDAVWGAEVRQQQENGIGQVFGAGSPANVPTCSTIRSCWRLTHLLQHRQGLPGRGVTAPAGQ